MRIILSTLALVLCALQAHAATSVHVMQVRADSIVAEGVRLDLEPGPALALRVERLAVAPMGYAFEGLRFRCRVVEEAGAWRCEGKLAGTRGGERGTVTLALSRDAATGGYTARVSRKRAALAIEQPATGPVAIALARVPLDWLGPLLATALPDATIGGGQVGATLALDAGTLTGDWTLDGASLDAQQGEVGAAALSAAGTLRFATTAGARAIDVDATLRGGEWLVAPVYVALPPTPVALGVELRENARGWDVPKWSWRDGDVLDASGSAVLGAGGALAELRVDSARAQFPLAYSRYLAAALAPAGFGELETEGRLRMTLDWSATQPARSTFAVVAGRLADGGGRFALEGLEADVALNEPRSSRIAWSAASIYRIPLDASDARATLAPGDWRLDAPFAVGMLGGTLRLPHVRRTVVDGRARWDAAIDVDALSLAELTKRFEWPAFGGTLSGTIPGLSTDGDVLRMEGGLTLDVFDGTVRVSELALERPFGVAPSLAADVALEDLDLTLLTQSFSFGQIDGKLDGRVAGLRLVDWAPVAFDATLRTDGKHKGRKRISQRAVNSLSSVGGGAAAGLQASVLKVFESFPYKAIGLSCRLANNVCEMSGLDSENAGYTIVEGSGLPRLTVVGHQKRVDWPVLVARLKAATEGTSPIVQ